MPRARITPVCVRTDYNVFLISRVFPECNSSPSSRLVKRKYNFSSSFILPILILQTDICLRFGLCSYCDQNILLSSTFKHINRCSNLVWSATFPGFSVYVVWISSVFRWFKIIYSSLWSLFTTLYFSIFDLTPKPDL